MFWRACDRTAGEQAAEDIVECNFRMEIADHRGRHLMKSVIPLDGKRIFDLDVASAANPAEVIAPQIHYGQVVAAVVCIVPKQLCEGCIVRRIESARHGAFQWSCDDATASGFKKELRRAG